MGYARKLKAWGEKGEYNMELIKTEMAPKERLTKYMDGEEVDRIPTILSSG